MFSALFPIILAPGIGLIIGLVLCTIGLTLNTLNREVNYKFFD
jgi:hypothetical protein